MKRRLFNLAAILSLALLPILLSAYAVHYDFVIDHIDTSRRHRACWLFFIVGLINFQYEDGVATSTTPRGWHYSFFHGPPASLGRVRDNLWTFHEHPMGPSIRYNLTFPAWLPALACTIAPLLWLRRRRRINRRGFAIEPSEPSHLADATAAQE